MKTLLIIESPGKRKTLEKILGPDYTVRASYGHVRDLPEREIGVCAPTFRPSYVISGDRAKRTLADLKAAAGGVDRVLLATDLDREGEAIAWHVAEALKLKSPQRVTYAEVTEKAVLAAIAAPRPLDMPRVRAQEARRVLDRLVGYTVSPALCEHAGSALSAGRVQSPAVRLVVDRERAIGGFKSTTHYGAELRFPVPVPWKAVWDVPLAEGQEYLLDQAQAEAAAGVRRLRVTAFADTKAKAAPAPPFTTSTLQQRAQVALKLRPKATMELAQRLYDAGAITYMRTDSPNLSDEACSAIATYARANGLPALATPRKWKAKGDAQEAHEAIRPTNVEQLDAGQTEDEHALYRLIWTRAVASQLADAVFAVRTARLETIGAEDPLSYTARGKTLVDRGWKAVYDAPEDDADEAPQDDDSDNPVPALRVGEEVDATDGAVLTKATKAPPRYTLASLVKELEARGIGRPSTYASILDNITSRGYIEEQEGGKLHATAVGTSVVDALVGTFEFIGLEYTRELEAELDRIAAGSAQYVDVVGAAHAQLTKELGRFAPAFAVTHACPACEKPLRRRTGKYGVFWSCSGYPQCNTAMDDEDGKPVPKKGRPAPAAPVDAPACPTCTKPLHRRIGKSKTGSKKPFDFWGCTGWPECNVTFKPDSEGNPIL